MSDDSWQWVRLCRSEELGEGRALGFDPLGIGHDQIFAVRRQGQVRVFLNNCPHLAVPLQYRKDRYLSADGQRIICYAHGAHFLPDSGLCVHGPCLGETLRQLAQREVAGQLYCWRLDIPTRSGAAGQQ